MAGIQFMTPSSFSSAFRVLANSFKLPYPHAPADAGTFLRCTRIDGRSQRNAELSIIIKPIHHLFLRIRAHFINKRASLDGMSRSRPSLFT